MTGSCHCQSVRFEIKGAPLLAANCHCGQCKKMLGGAFNTVVMVKEEDLSVTSGAATISRYPVSEQTDKHFCSRCGSPLYNLSRKFPGKAMIALGALDDPAAITPGINVYCESMLPWVAELAKIQSFPQAPGR